MATVLLGILRPLEIFNTVTGHIGKYLSVFAMGLMVLIILLQVFFRYILNNALPWPDEAARFLMLWLTGLMAPVALRQGGFVSIDMISMILPKFAKTLLTFFLLFLAMTVLAMGVKLGWKHVNGGWLFASSSLKLPLHLIGMKVVKIKLAWMYMSLFVGVVLMLCATIELILREIITVLGAGDRLNAVPQLVDGQGGAE